MGVACTTGVNVSVATGDAVVGPVDVEVLVAPAVVTWVLVDVAAGGLVWVAGTAVFVGTAGVSVGCPPDGGADPANPFAVTAYRPGGRSGTRNPTVAFPALARLRRPGSAR